jgi:hypothetical protein
MTSEELEINNFEYLDDNDDDIQNQQMNEILSKLRVLINIEADICK